MPRLCRSYADCRTGCETAKLLDGWPEVDFIGGRVAVLKLWFRRRVWASGDPMSWIARVYRERVLSAQWPSWQELGVLTAYSAAVLVAGGLFFRVLKRGFTDVL